MKTIRAFLHHRIARAAIAGALLAFVALPAMVALAMKALGLAHGASLPTWLLDVGHNMKFLGAAGGAGAGAAAAGDPIPPKDKDPDPCAGEERAVLQDQGTIDMYKGQLDSYSKQIAALGPSMKGLVKQATDLAPQAQWEVEKQFAITAMTELVELVVEMAGPLGEGAKTVGAAVGIVSDPVGMVQGEVRGYNYVEFGKFLSEMYQYFEVSQGNLNALEELCKDNPLPVASQFLQVMEELQQLVDQGHAFVNQMNQTQDELNDAQKQLQVDQQALADCQKANSGGGGSGGGDSGGGDAGADV